MKKLLVLLILLYSTSVISANPLAKVYSANDPVYRKLEIISIESGMLPPPSASPWSGYELYAHLQKINET